MKCYVCIGNGERGFAKTFEYFTEEERKNILANYGEAWRIMLENERRKQYKLPPYDDDDIDREIYKEMPPLYPDQEDPTNYAAVRMAVKIVLKMLGKYNRKEK